MGLEAKYIERMTGVFEKLINTAHMLVVTDAGWRRAVIGRISDPGTGLPLVPFGFV